MRRIVSVLMLALCPVVLLAAAPLASAAKKKSASAKPAITRVAPMRISVGGKLTITGKNFKSKRSANTVIFRAPSGRVAFAKPRRASTTRLVVTVPGAVRRLLSGSASSLRPTRFKLRVLAGKFSKYTSRRLSPVITATADGSGPGGGVPASCDDDSDHDNDLLTNDFETQIKTDPCLLDTDLDGVEDGYEYQSAVDLNYYPAALSLPYPGKRPYPNALDSGDAGTDYDGDGLQQREEFSTWLLFSADGAARSGRPQTLSGLVYSEGLQRSVIPFAAPAGALARWALDQDGDGQLSDDERDADGDGLGNWDEQHGRFTEGWWPAQFDGAPLPKESKYPGLDFLDVGDYDGLSPAPPDEAGDGLVMAVSDMDGDGVLDGNDDHDHDGLSNQFEVNRPGDYSADTFTPAVPPATGYTPGPNIWAYVNPFNPCKPFRSQRCHAHPPFAYYDGDQLPFVGWDPPAGYPGSAPPTPDN